MSLSASPTPPPAQAPVWHLAYSKPKLEPLALEHLLRQGFEAWYPEIKRWAKRGAAKNKAWKLEPMFPRYVFFRPASAQHSISGVRSTTGVSHLVQFGHRMACLSDRAVQELRAWSLAQQNTDPVQLLGLHPGTAVAITEGPFKGLEGMVTLSANERVTVLLHLLGQDHEIGLPWQHLSALSA